MIKVEREDFEFLVDQTQDTWMVEREELGFRTDRLNSVRDWLILYQTGQLTIFSIKREEAVLGYLTFHVGKNIIENYMQAINLNFYIKPKYRGGRSAITALREVEKYFKEETNVETVTIQMNTFNPQTNLLSSLGFEESSRQVLYSKSIRR